MILVDGEILEPQWVADENTVVVGFAWGAVERLAAWVALLLGHSLEHWACIPSKGHIHSWVVVVVKAEYPSVDAAEYHQGEHHARIHVV